MREQVVQKDSSSSIFEDTSLDSVLSILLYLELL